MRIYPVPFRRLEEKEQYRKFDWIECPLVRRKADPRPESFRPSDTCGIVPVDHMGTSYKWRERRRLLLQNATVYDSLDKLITGAKNNTVSLAVFKPAKVIDFIWEDDDPEWSPQRLEEMRALHGQLALFEDNSWRETFKVIPKLPYSFSYRFKDSGGRQSELQVLDWETGALYWNCLKAANGDKQAALDKVREKYFDTFLKTDLHFFLGTTQQFHRFAPNPWVIVGVFPIPHDAQGRLF